MTTGNVTPQDDRIRACAIARDLESFEYLIDEMQSIFGDSWGGLEIDDALPVLSSKHAAQIEHVILALGPDDANNLEQIIQIIDRAKSSNQNVTLVTHDLSSNALHQLLRSGADDFVPYPLPKGSLEALLVTRAGTQQPIDIATEPMVEVPTPAAEPAAMPLTDPMPKVADAPAPFAAEPVALTPETAAPVAAERAAPPTTSRLDLSAPLNVPTPKPAETPEETAPVSEELAKTASAVRDQLTAAGASASDIGKDVIAETKETVADNVSQAKTAISDAVEAQKPSVEPADSVAQDLAAKLDLAQAEVAPVEPPLTVERVVAPEKAPEIIRPEPPVVQEPVIETAKEPVVEQTATDTPVPSAETAPVVEEEERKFKSFAQKVTEKVAGVAPISLKPAQPSDETLQGDGFERLEASEEAPAPTPEKTAEVQPLRKQEEAPAPEPLAEAPKAEPVPEKPAAIVPPVAAPVAPVRSGSQGGKNGIVFPVYGTAGGVGTSTFAANLAWEIQTIVEKEGRSACIIDLGLQYGSVATYLDVPRSDATMELLSNMGAADEQALQGTMKFHKDKLAVFPSPVDPVPLELVEPADIAKLIDLATSAYDIVIIDMPNTLTSWTETVLERAKLFFAFTEMEMRSAQNALRFLRALKAEELPYEKVQFVINRAPKMTDLAGRSRIKRMSDSLNVEFRWLLPDGGKQVVAAGDQGTTLANAAARNPLRKEIRKIAEKMAELTTSEADVKASA